MNILPKKSWHVLSRDNIQKVRRDEAEAKAKEEEIQRRAEIAEKEARLNLMRKRAHERDGYSDDDEPVRKEPKLNSSLPVTDRGHINFFADVRQGVGMQTTNVDHDKEKKEEQEKYEKRIGLLNYLVDKDKSDDPWYSKSKVSEEGAKSKRLKELMDPLNDMKRFVSQTKKLSDDHSTATGGRGVVPTILAAPGTSSHSSMAKGNPVASGKSTVDQESRKCTKSHKHHKEHKSKSKHKKKDLKEKEREKDERLEELRRQRRKREEAERAKAEALLRGRHSRNGMEGRDSGTSQAVEDSSRRYNSQFNPHLVRQRRN